MLCILTPTRLSQDGQQHHPLRRGEGRPGPVQCLQLLHVNGMRNYEQGLPIRFRTYNASKLPWHKAPGFLIEPSTERKGGGMSADHVSDADEVTHTANGTIYALALLVHMLEQKGMIDTGAYVRALKNTFNAADGDDFERSDYTFIQTLASVLEVSGSLTETKK